MTISFLLETGNGHFKYAGAHETILIYRTKTNKIEEIITFGMWLGILPDISKQIKKGSGSFKLEKGDICLLYTDGVIETMNEHKEQYDLHRLSNLLQKYGNESTEFIKEKIIQDLNDFKY